MNDALGNPVIIGNWYGYTQRDGSYLDVVIGKLEKINAIKVSLTEVRRHTHLSGKKVDRAWCGSSNRVQVSSHAMFPVPNPEA